MIFLPSFFSFSFSHPSSSLSQIEERKSERESSRERGKQKDCLQLISRPLLLLSLLL